MFAALSPPFSLQKNSQQNTQACIEMKLTIIIFLLRFKITSLL
jgi:hypothetical protein